MSVAGVSAQDAAAKADWREQYAYAQGTQAYVFGLPHVDLPTVLWDWVTRPKSADELPLYSPIDHFSHVNTLADASYRGGGSPNEGTRYSTATGHGENQCRPLGRRFIRTDSPGGQGDNWIQTVLGKGWFTILRLYGALDPWFDKA